MGVRYSIIVPVYNSERYLSRCIDSILKQTVKDFELILVDDGSRDSSGKICDKYTERDKRIVVIHQLNKGVSAARNVGISVAKGKYIVFVDSDDEVEDKYLEYMDYSSVELVVSGVKSYNGNGVIHHILDYSTGGINEITSTIIEKMLENKSINFVYAKRFNRNIIKDNGLCFVKDIDLGEDTLFCINYICLCETMEYVNGTAYLYYKYDNTTLSSFSDKYIDKIMKTDTEILKVLEIKFPNVKNSVAWNSRCWNEFYYSIFYILREWNVSSWKKILLLQRIFNGSKYRELEKEINVFMENDSKLIRRVLSSKNSVLVILFWKILNRHRKGKDEKKG